MMKGGTNPTGADERLSYLAKFAIFFILGYGPNWVIATVLAQEIPYMQNHQPEGLALAAYMNAANASATLCTFGYWVYTTYVGPIPHNVALPLMLGLSIFSGIIAVAAYNVTAGKVSIILYLACFLAGAVGSLATVAMNPFMTMFQNDFISAARSGGSGIILLTSIIALAQNPGADNPNFSVRVYYLIFTFIMIPPVIAYRYVIKEGLGMRDWDGDLDINDGKKDIQAIVANPVQVNSGKAAESLEENNLPVEKADSEFDPAMIAITPLDSYGHSFARWIMRQVSSCRNITPENLPWWEHVVPYMLLVGWVNLNTWGLLTAFIPYAVYYSSQVNYYSIFENERYHQCLHDGASHVKFKGDGSRSLAIAYEVSAFALFMGDLSTTKFRMPFSYSLIVFTIGAFTINCAAFSINESSFNHPGMTGILVFLFIMGRYVRFHYLLGKYSISL